MVHVSDVAMMGLAPVFTLLFTGMLLSFTLGLVVRWIGRH